MKNQNAQIFDLAEFEAKKICTSSVTIYEYQKDWLNKKEKDGNKINISKLLRAVLDQLIESEKK